MLRLPMQKSQSPCYALKYYTNISGQQTTEVNDQGDHKPDLIRTISISNMIPYQEPAKLWYTLDIPPRPHIDGIITDI